jgi:hypothetical protein
LRSWSGVLPRLEKKIHDAFLALGLGGLLLAPVIQPGNAGFDFFQQLVIGGDFPVDVAFHRLDALSLHLTGGRPHVDAGDFINALALIAAVVDALRPACGLQRPVGVSCPCRPPLLGVLSPVPVGGIFTMIFPAETKLSLTKERTRASCSALDSSTGKATSISLASWASLDFSICSTLFQRVERS